MKTIGLALLLTLGILAGIYHKYVSALIDPCQAVQTFCDQNETSVSTALICGADSLKQLFKESTRISCLRTWLDLNQVESPTLDGWLDSLEDNGKS